MSKRAAEIKAKAAVGWRQFDLTDDGIARRFAAAEEGDALRWVPAWRTWMEWRGDRWARVSVEVTKNRIRRFVSGAIESAARNNGDGDVIGKLGGYLKKDRINAVEDLARGDLLTDAGDFDTDPMLLNCRNGTLDLTTLKLRAHRREDMLTQQTNCEYAPKARSADWDKVLADALSRDVVAYVQRVFGYALTGSTKEEKFFEFYGVSGAGKSTILEAFGEMLGSYSRSVSAATLAKSGIKRSGSDATPDIARLQGARFVFTTEFDKGDALAEGLVKALSGRNKITTRGLHQVPFEFFPQFKIFLDANFRQRLSGSPESGMERRLVVIEFTQRVEDPDDGLKTRLLSEEGAAAILAWAIKGLAKWNRDGLGKLPAVIERSNQAYLHEADIYGNFIEECLEEEEGARTPVDDLYRIYVMWADRNGHSRPAAKPTLTSELVDRGFEDPKTTSMKLNGRKRGVRIWRDVAIQASWRGRIRTRGTE